MRDGQKTKADLLKQLSALHCRVSQLEQAEEALHESEQKYRDLVEQMSEGLGVADADGVLTYVNPRIAEMLEYSPEQMVGKHAFVFVDEESIGLVKQQAEKRRKGMSRKFELVLTSKTGKKIPVMVSAKPMFKNGKCVGSFAIFIDITEHKKAEERIRKLTSALDQSIDGIAVTIDDLDPKLVYVNDAFARMHGYRPADMIGMPVTKLYNKEQMDEYERAANQLRAQGSWEGEIGHTRKDGTAFPAYSSVTLLKNDEGETAGAVAIARDITEAKRSEEELNAYRKKIARTEQLASLGTLSATLAHELTQPLTVIRLSIENSLAALNTTARPPTVVENLREGLNEVSSVTSIVNRFRNFARRSSKRIVTEVDLKAVAERIIKLLDESAWRAKVTLQVEGMEELPLVYSYEKDLEQLFFALVENAIQAAEGKKGRRVTISGTARDEHIELQFSDNCSGIAPENLDKIFEPFFTTKAAAERTGLGLCVVQQVISRVRGKVRVESQLGKGSTFFVTLPTDGVER